MNTLTWRLLNAEELTRVYLNEMRRDFPPTELKPLSMVLNSEAVGDSHTWGVYDGETLVAYLLMVRPGARRSASWIILPCFRPAAPPVWGQSCWPPCPAKRPGPMPSSLRPSCRKKPTTRLWRSAVWGENQIIRSGFCQIGISDGA